LERGLTDAETELFDTLAHLHLDMRLARGLAFVDETAIPGRRYRYSLHGVRQDGSEILLATSAIVIAGRLVLPDPPSGITLTAKDHKVLILWNRNPYAAGFVVERSRHPWWPAQRVHEGLIQLDLTKDIDGNDLAAPQPGFLDFRRWDEDGQPTVHTVNGTPVAGPANDITYFYQVASVNVFGHVAW
jgi:hypothetical protein